MSKNRFKKILVALDGSKNSIRALRKAIELANQANSSITGITVIQVAPSETTIIRTVIKKALIKHYKNFSKIAKRMCTKNGVNFLDVVEFGEEGSTIVSFAQKNNFDLIVMGSGGLGKIGEIFLGSTSNHVVHLSKIPVLIVK
jgi:nucleotide-binding universal stress UspA family protein